MSQNNNFYLAHASKNTAIFQKDDCVISFLAFDLYLNEMLSIGCWVSLVQIVLKKREPLNYLVPDGSAGFSSRLAASQDMMNFNPPSVRYLRHTIQHVRPVFVSS